MSILEVYLNDYQAELDGKTVFRITRNGFNVFNPTKRSSSHTNSISLPPTPNNIDFFDAWSIHSISDVPYSTLKIKIVEGGVEIFYGTCYLGKSGQRITVAGITGEAEILGRLKPILCSQTFTELDMTGGISGGFYTLLRPFGHKKIDSATLYTQRNGLSDVYAPLANFGKQDQVPNTLVNNHDFSTVQAPWTTEPFFDGTVTWTYNPAGNGTMNATIPLNGISLSIVNRETIVYAGFRYNLSFLISLTLNVSTTAHIIGIKEGNIVEEISNTNYTTLGVKTVSVEFDSDENYYGIGIYFTRPATAGSQAVTVTNAIISDVSFIQIKSPFYIPMFSWVEAIKRSVAKVFTGTFNHALNFSQAQLDYINNCLITTVREDLNYPQWFLDQRNRIQEAGGAQVVGLGDNVIKFPNKIKGSYGDWLESGTLNVGDGVSGDEYYNTYELQATDDADSGFYADIEVDIVINVTTITGAAPEAWVELKLNSGTSVYFRSETFATAGRKQIKIRTRDKMVDNLGAALSPYSFPKGVQMGRGWVMDVHSRTDGTITAYSATVEYARFSVIPIPYPQDEAVLTQAYILPDISALDLLRDYVIRTCSMIRENAMTNTIDIVSLESIIANKSQAVNWTNKRENKVDDIEYSLSDYAQENFFIDKNGKDNEFGEMLLSITNQNVPPQKIFYESPVEAITDRSCKGTSCGYLDVFNFDSQYKYNEAVEITSSGYDAFTERQREFEGVNPKINLTKIRDSNTNDPIVKYGTSTAATFKVASYAKWSEFKELFFTAFGEAIDKVKGVERGYNLTADDMNSLDLFKLIEDDQGYYLIVDLKYTPGQITPVKLLKVF